VLRSPARVPTAPPGVWPIPLGLLTGPPSPAGPTDVSAGGGGRSLFARVPPSSGTSLRCTLLFVTPIDCRCRVVLRSRARVPTAPPVLWPILPGPLPRIPSPAGPADVSTGGGVLECTISSVDSEASKPSQSDHANHPLFRYVMSGQEGIYFGRFGVVLHWRH